MSLWAYRAPRSFHGRMFTVPVYGCDVDPRHPEESVGSGPGWYEHYVEPSFKHRARLLKQHLGIDMWEEESWMEEIAPYVEFDGKPTVGSDEVFDFQCLMEDGAYCDERCTFTYGDTSEDAKREHRALRILYTWLMRW
eukprot:4904468-Prymnesium_polylepis.1